MAENENVEISLHSPDHGDIIDIHRGGGSLENLRISNIAEGHVEYRINENVSEENNNDLLDVSNSLDVHRIFNSGQNIINAAISEIRNDNAAIQLRSDGTVVIEIGGKQILKISNDNITIHNNIEISLNALRKFSEIINDNFCADELVDIIKERIRIKSNQEIIDKRLGTIQDE